MAKEGIDKIKKEAVSDLANARNFILIAFGDKEIKRHVYIKELGTAFLACREMHTAKMNLMYPPQPSAPPVK